MTTRRVSSERGLAGERLAAGWRPEQVASIRHSYVDQARVIVAIGGRIKGRLQNGL